MPALGRVTVIGLALTALGCPSGDDTGTTEAMDSTSTSSPPTTTGIDPDTSSGSPDTGTTVGGSQTGTTTAGMETDDTTAGMATEGTTAGMETEGTTDGTTTGGMELCEIMLPPPPACAMPGAGFPGTPNLVCDPIAQTGCAADEKCMPCANDGGGSWNATRCSPINPMPDAVGDPCTVEASGVSGIDSCEQGAMCWDVDPATNMGTCIELCGCAYDTPTCQTPNTTCSISNNSSLTICNPVCNPLDPAACDPGLGCYPVGDFFQCAPDASGASGAPGDPCMFINACEPGAICVSAAALPGCAGGVGCCTATCDATDPADPCPAGTACTEWYAAGAAPDACLQTVGACVAP